MEGTKMAIISDDDYKSQWDAETLAEAENIKSDPNRLTKAKDAAAKMAEEQQEKTKNLKKVARKSRQNTRSDLNGAATSGSKAPKTGNGFNVFKRV